MALETDGRLCPTCKKEVSTDFDPEQGEEICRQCGAVVADKLETADEHDGRTLGDGEQFVNRLQNEVIGQISRRGVISNSALDANGKELPQSSKQMIDAVRRLDKFAEQSRDKHFKNTLPKFDAMSAELNLSDSIKDSALHIYRRFYAKGAITGRPAVAFLLAAIYLACRQNNTFRSVAELDTVKRRYGSRGNIIRATRLIQRTLEISLEPADPAVLLPRLASGLGVSERTVRKAYEVVAAVRGRLPNCKPPVIAGAALRYVLMNGDEKIPGAHYKTAELLSVSTTSLTRITQRVRQIMEEQGKVEPKDLSKHPPKPLPKRILFVKS